MAKNIGENNFKLTPVVTKRVLGDFDEAAEDIRYWLTRPVEERIAAVTFLVSQTLSKGERLDKTIVSKRNIRHI